MSGSKEVKCMICGNKFKYLKNLRAHVKKHHPHLKVDEIAPTNREKNKHLYVFTCDTCSKSYRRERNLSEHKKIVHSSTKKIEILVPCTICPFISTYKTMNDHYLNEHNASQNVENFEFDNFNDFKSWKREVEDATDSRFVKNCGSVNTGKQIYNYYKCYRNGFYTSKNSDQRHLKNKGSYKINGYCPASINVTISKLTKKCAIKFNGNHVGHENKLGYSFLDKDKFTKNDKASKISQYIPFVQILDEIQDNIISDNHLKGTHLLSKKDLCNIEIDKELDTTKCLKDTETTIIVSQLNNEKISNQSIFQIEKEKFKLHFEKMFNKISNMEELKILKECFSVAIPTLIALQNNAGIQPFKSSPTDNDSK